MKKSANRAALPALLITGERTDDLETKPAIVPTFIQFGLEFGEH